jgi:phage terminase large subunit-like protein/predicted RNA-binding Zn-ribbon protein involved in translation (DUF1610 family)
VTLGLAELLAERERRREVALRHDWRRNARPSQRLPEGTWRTWLLVGGRGAGKTRTGSETVRQWAKEFPIVSIVAPTSADLRDVCIEGPGGILQVCPPTERPTYESSKRQLTWPNGAKSLLFSAEEPDRLRGPQHYKLWVDELMAMANPEALWDQSMFGLRLGRNPQSVVTTTPRPSKFLKALMSSPTTHLTRTTTYENRENLAGAFLGEIITKYEGTRLGRQELNAELLEDNPGALWKLSQIEADRVDSADFWANIFPKLRRIVGGLDPSGTSTEKSDECGIVFAGSDSQTPPHFYVFDDRSCVDTPDGWARKAVAAYHQHKADRIVAEGNFGGDMVEAVLRHVDRNVSFKKVTASRGKIVRAEPVAAVYEQHRVHHVGTFPQLEDQMCEYDPAVSTGSPDRMDALVWAMTELGVSSMHGLIELWKQQADELRAKLKPQTADAPAGESSKQASPIVKPQVVSRDLCPACGAERIHLAATFRDPAIVRCPGCGLEGPDNEKQVAALLARRRKESRADSYALFNS